MKTKTKGNLNRLLTYKEYYKKYFGKVTAGEILFGWFDYCEKHGLDGQTGK